MTSSYLLKTGRCIKCCKYGILFSCCLSPDQMHANAFSTEPVNRIMIGCNFSFLNMPIDGKCVWIKETIFSNKTFYVLFSDDERLWLHLLLSYQMVVVYMVISTKMSILM